MSIRFPQYSKSSFPNAQDSYIVFTNVNTDNISLVNQYYSYISASNFTAAAQLLTDNPSLKYVIVTADTFQTIWDAISAIEATWSSNIITTIGTCVTNQGAWNATTVYPQFGIVTNNGKAYMCTNPNTPAGTLVTNTSYYVQLTIVGASGTGMAFYPNYDLSKIYKTLDCVPYNNALWVSLVDNNLNHEPDISPDYWSKVVTGINQIITSQTQPTGQDSSGYWNQTNSTNNSFKVMKSNGDNSYTQKYPVSNADFISDSNSSGITRTYTCTTTSNNHNLVGTGANGKFYADADFNDADTFSINGTTVEAKIQNGDNPIHGFFKHDNWVSFTYDASNAKINFVSGGGTTTIPNYAGQLVVHVTTSDGGSLGDTKVQVTNTQLGSYYVQSLDALGNTTFELLDNHTYAVTLIDYPDTYYGGADTVQITGGETTTLNFEMTTEPDIIGWDYDTSTKEMIYTDGAANWTPATFDENHHIQYHSFTDSWLLRGIHSCLYKNGIVQYYLDEDDNTKKADGTDADITSGTDGDVMVEFQKVYTKANTYTDTNDHLHYKLQMTKEPLSGYYAIGFINKDSIEQDTTYIAKYLAHRDENNKLHSLSGSSIDSDPYSNLFTFARNVGSQYNLFHDEQLQLICSLFSMLFRTLKFEDIYPNCVYNSYRNNGLFNTSGLFNNNNEAYPKIFGIENLGCALECIEGKIVVNQEEKDSSGNSSYIQFIQYTIQPRSYWYLVRGNTGGTSTFLSGVHQLHSAMSSNYPFTGKINSFGEKKVFFNNNMIHNPINGHYSETFFICTLGRTSETIGIFSESYDLFIGYYTSETGGYYVDNSYAFRCRLASIPV